MDNKKYFLTVKLNIDGKEKIIELIEYNLVALQKYIAFCNGPKDLIKYMPNDTDFSVKYFIINNLGNNISEDNDPFEIRTSISKQSKIIRKIYSKDIDVLLANKEIIKQRITDYCSISLGDLNNDNINENIIQILKYIYDNYRGKAFEKEKYNLFIKKLNWDKPEFYDEKYEKAFKRPWLILGISEKCVSALVDEVFKDDRKRFDLAFYLKDKTGNLIPSLTFEKKNKLISELEHNLNKRYLTIGKIRQNIRQNVRKYKSSIKEENPKLEASTPCTDEEIIKYNQERLKDKKDSVLEKNIELSKEIIELKNEIKKLNNEMEKLNESKKYSFTDKIGIEKIDERINLIKESIISLNTKLIEKEYILSELENNNYNYSDAGFVVDKSI